MNVMNLLKQELVLTCGIKPENIRAEAQLVAYGLDSVRSMDLIIALEDAYDIEISDYEVAQLETVQDVLDIVNQKRGGES